MGQPVQIAASLRRGDIAPERIDRSRLGGRETLLGIRRVMLTKIGALPAGFRSCNTTAA
jgi:hypothetical protein